MATQREWSIAELAREFDVTHRTIRHYESLGLLTPERRGTQRVFDRRERIRLGLILRGRRVGFGLDEIRRIVDMYDAPVGEAGQLRYLLDQIAVRREDLMRRRDDLDVVLGELDRLDERCRRDLEELRSTEPHRPATNRPTG